MKSTFKLPMNLKSLESHFCELKEASQVLSCFSIDKIIPGIKLIAIKLSYLKVKYKETQKIKKGRLVNITLIDHEILNRSTANSQR